MGLDLVAVLSDELVQALNVPVIDLLGLVGKLLVERLGVVTAGRRAVEIDELLPQVVPRLGQLELLGRIALGVLDFDLGQIGLQPLVAVDIGQHAVEEAGHRPAGAGEEALGLGEELVGMANLPNPFVQEMAAQCQPQNDQHHDGAEADGEFVGIQGIPPSLREFF